MHVEIDTLKCVKMLQSRDFTIKDARNLVEAFTKTKIRNVYSKNEVDIMLSQTIKAQFEEYDKLRKERIKESDKKLEREREIFEKQLAIQREQMKEDIKEIRSSRRWLGTLIISVGLGLASYITALFHMTH
jgi:DNA-binding transcriptional MerR regulator